VEEHEDLLMELVTTDMWRAVKREVAATSESLIHRLTQPINSLEELVAKEGNASRLAALRQLVADIERKAEQRAKQLR
jgi:hypothetical protein